MSTQIDDLFDVLQEPRRQRLLRELQQSAGEGDEFLLGQDGNTDRLLAKHVDLPKLAEAGFIEWDPETGAISKGPRFEEVTAVLDLFDDHAEELPFAWPQSGSATYLNNPDSFRRNRDGHS